MTLPLEMIMYTCPKCKVCTANLHPGEGRLLKLCPAYTRYGWFAYSGGGKCYLAQGLREGAWSRTKSSRTCCSTARCAARAPSSAAPSQDPTQVARLVRQRGGERRCGGPPGDAQTVVKSTMNYRNPYQQPKAMRYRLGQRPGHKGRYKGEGRHPLLRRLYRGDDTGRAHFAHNTVKLLDAAGEDFGTLGRKEICCGAPLTTSGPRTCSRKWLREHRDVERPGGRARAHKLFGLLQRDEERVPEAHAAQLRGRSRGRVPRPAHTGGPDQADEEP